MASVNGVLTPRPESLVALMVSRNLAAAAVVGALMSGIAPIATPAHATPVATATSAVASTSMVPTAKVTTSTYSGSRCGIKGKWKVYTDTAPVRFTTKIYSRYDMSWAKWMFCVNATKTSVAKKGSTIQLSNGTTKKKTTGSSVWLLTLVSPGSQKTLIAQNYGKGVTEAVGYQLNG